MEDFSGLVKYQLTDLRLFEGKAPVGPPEECVKDSLTQVCAVMCFGRRGTYSIRENKFFGLKESKRKGKSDICFV